MVLAKVFVTYGVIIQIQYPLCGSFRSYDIRCNNLANRTLIIYFSSFFRLKVRKMC